MSDLNKKVNQAIKLLKIAEESAVQKSIEREREREVINELRIPYGQFIDYNGVVQVPQDHVEVCYSSGKDSDVILHLAKMAGIKHTALRRDTTIDPPLSNKHARDKGAVIIKPEITFFQTIQKSGLPSMWVRHCCAYLKEKHGLDVAIQGIRREESQKRAERYKEPTICRLYPHKQKTEVFLPILEWTTKDIKEFVKQEHIQCHQLYYDNDGNFCPDRRLGCLGCPLISTKKRLEQLKQHPKFIIQYAKNVYIYIENQTKKRMEKGMSYEEAFEPFALFEDEYGAVFFNLFCKNKEEYIKKTTGLFGNLDTKQWLEDYFKIDLP